MICILVRKEDMWYSFLGISTYPFFDSMDVVVYACVNSNL